MHGLRLHIPLSRWVRWVLAALLLTAAVLKLSHGASLSPLPLPYPFSLLSKAVPWLEILLAIWLFSGIRPSWALGLTTVTFLCFCVVTLWMVVHGTSDCGCFGAVSLSPKVTYWIDLTALIVGIASFRSIQIRSLLLMLLLPGVALYLGARALAVYQPTMAKIEVGNPWPPHGAVSCPVDLSKGRWVVLIYDSNCGHCRSLAAGYASDASEWGAKGKQIRLVLLDAGIPEDEGVPTQSSLVVWGSLLKREFYDHTPILLLLNQGKVLGIEEGWGAVDWSDPIHAPWIQ